MPLSVALICAGALVVLGVWLQVKRFRTLREDTDFYAKRRTLPDWLWLHAVVAPFYMALVMPFSHGSFRERTQTPRSHPHRMPLSTFVARYAAHFTAITLLLLGLLVFALQSRDPSIVSPSRLAAIALLLYAFYWKWLFSSLLLTLTLALEILSLATGANHSPFDLLTNIFMLAFDEIFTVEIAVVYVCIVAAAVIASAAFDILEYLIGS